MIKTVVLDLDDTLIETQALYEQARAELGRYLQGFGVDPAVSVEVAKTKSVQLMGSMGYAKSRFPQSFEETLRYFHANPSPEQVGQVRGLAEAVFVATAAPREGARYAIDMLRREFRLVLFTVGDADVQQKRVDELGYAELFHEVCIVNEKSPASLLALGAGLGLTVQEMAVIGDSVRTDIKPAAEAGILAILVASNNWQLHEMQGHELPAGTVKFATLCDAALALVKEKLEQLLRSAWSAKTSASDKGWSAANSAFGQCAVNGVRCAGSVRRRHCAS